MMFMNHDMDDANAGGGGGGEFVGGMGGLQTMGILNALRTGDPRLDMILAMCLPFVIRFVFEFISRFEDFCSYQYWVKLLFREPHIHHRTILYRSSRNCYGDVTDLDEDSQNRVLQKAIQLYLHTKVKLNLQEADTNLTSMESKSALGGSYYDDYDDDQENDDPSSRTIVGILRKYSIVKKPPSNQWHDLGSFNGEKNNQANVHLYVTCVEESNDGGGASSSSRKSSSSTLSFSFKSTDGHAIDTFINTAYSWYVEELKKMEDISRYLYELKSFGAGSSSGRDGDDDGHQHGRVYKRYRLSDEKTFDSLFFRQKEPLLTLIHHFQDRSGKYAIKGYPHKLGLLLHGPPGSGKTSLIKAMAQHTGRSIINVPLARITTNAELMSIFFDKKLRVEDEYVTTKLRFRDVIFVIEDVDAASKIVKRRDGKKTATKVQRDYIDVPLICDKSPWQVLLESGDENCKELVTLLIEKSSCLKKEALRGDAISTATQRMMALPGLCAVGDYTAGNNPVLQRVSDEAVSSAESIMEKYSTADRYMGVHAEKILRILQAGAEVDEQLENELLGISPPTNTIPPLAPLSRTREVSFTKYGEEDDEHVHIEQPPVSEEPAAPVTNFQPPATNNNGSKTSGATVAGPLASWNMVKGLDELNLQGLLNVLDGVVDSPGRIVIMTTNHPELLDPALIRPGRIDKKLFLGYMGSSEMIDMLEHYFQTKLSEEQCVRVKSIVSGTVSRSSLNLTPAQVEQMTAEYEDLDYMIVALEEKAQSLVPHHGKKYLGATSTKSSLAYDV